LKKSNWKRRPSRQEYTNLNTYRGPPKHRFPDPQEQAPAPEKNENPSDSDGAIRFWTAVVGLFTGILAIVGGLQFWAFVQSERAFLSIVSMSIDGALPKAGDKSVQLFFKLKITEEA
jgi:hypothetical protein